MSESKPKYQKIRTWFNIKAQIGRDGKKVKFFHPKARNKGEVVTVRPFNGETTRKYPQSVSWSHGLTHFEIKEWGKPLYCGTNAFEQCAVPVRAPRSGR